MRTPYFFIRPTALLLTTIFLLATGCKKIQTNSTTTSSPAYSPTSSVTQAIPRLHPTQTLTVGNHTFNIQIAKTETEQTQGLSHIQSIENNEGMLFLFDPPSEPTFWMKDMLFPIDIVWIKNSKVVGISENLPTLAAGQSKEQLPLYLPPTNIDMALEINANIAKLYGLQTGDMVSPKIR